MLLDWKRLHEKNENVKTELINGEDNKLILLKLKLLSFFAEASYSVFKTEIRMFQISIKFVLE